MIVTREDVRKVIVQRVEDLRATFGHIDIEYYNQKAIDRSLQKDPFLRVVISYQDGMQVDLGVSGWTRAVGVILLEALAKEGTGSSRQNEILEHFRRGMHKTDTMAPVRTLAARYNSGGVSQGWSSEGEVIPFWYDTQ